VTIGLLTPFYFVRAGYFVSIPAVLAAPLGVIAFLAVEMATKIVGVYPMARRFGSPRKDVMHTALLMASGLTFGTISTLFGLSNKITDESQYSTLVAAIVATAIMSAMIANGLYLPRHRLLREAAPQRVGSADPAKESVLEG
jgi:glutathione-regulated potassium-efflux system ancillary protein KefC